MKNLKQLFFALIMGLAVGVAAAADKGSADEAKSMVERALAHIKKVGAEKAFKDFSDLANKDWHDRDVYLYAYNFSGENIAHGANLKLIGKNLIDMKTPDGKLLIKEMVEMSKTKGSGWIDYDWPHPETRKVERKSGYVKRIPGFDGFVGSGIYK